MSNFSTSTIRFCGTFCTITATALLFCSNHLYAQQTSEKGKADAAFYGNRTRNADGTVSGFKVTATPAAQEELKQLPEGRMINASEHKQSTDNILKGASDNQGKKQPKAGESIQHTSLQTAGSPPDFNQLKELKPDANGKVNDMLPETGQRPVQPLDKYHSKKDHHPQSPK